MPRFRDQGAKLFYQWMFARVEFWGYFNGDSKQVSFTETLWTMRVNGCNQGEGKEVGSCNPKRAY